MELTVRSSAFRPGEAIPTKYSQDGQGVSPPLTFGDVPSEAKELALICDDPDAPMDEPFVHWVAYHIPPETSLPEGVAPQVAPPSPPGITQGVNSFGGVGYGGPAPPKGHGTHHYHFKVYALETGLPIEGSVDKAELMRTIERHVLGTAELIGTYER